MDITNISLTAKIATSFTKTVNTVVMSAAKTIEQITALTDGTGVGNADIIYYDDTVAIGTSATVTLDLAGVLTDVFGDTVTMARLKAIIVKHKSTSSSSGVKVGGNSGGSAIALFADLTDAPVVKPGGVFMQFDPSAVGLCVVTGGSADELELTNQDGSNAAEVEIMLIGASA